MKHKTKRSKKVRRGGQTNYGNTGNENLNRTRRNYYRQQARLYGYPTSNNNNNNNINNNENKINNNQLNTTIPNNIMPEFIPNNATNTITMNDINFTKPAFTFNKEMNFGRYYQNPSTLEHIFEKRENPHTRAKINKIKWYMPKKNSTKKNNKNNN